MAPKGSSIKNEKSPYECRRLSNLTIQCNDLTYKKFLEILSYFNDLFVFNRKLKLNLYFKNTKLQKKVIPLINKITGYCSSKKFTLEIHSEPSIDSCLGNTSIKKFKRLASEKAILNLKYFNANLEKVEEPLYHCLAGVSSYWVEASTGDIFACKMFKGNKKLILGNVYQNKWDNIIRTYFVDGNVEKKPLCQNCWAKHLCGGGCPFAAFKINRSIYRPQKEICRFIKTAYRSVLKEYVSSSETGKDLCR